MFKAKKVHIEENVWKNSREIKISWKKWPDLKEGHMFPPEKSLTINTKFRSHKIELRKRKNGKRSYWTINDES